MNLPNALTIARLFLSFLMVYFIFEQDGRWVWLALLFFLLASLTDYWDGRLARKRGQITVFGALMDPIADKTLTLCAFVSFWKLDLVAGLWVAAVAVRDAWVTAYRLFSLGRAGDPSAGAAGKKKTFLQVLYISAVLLYLWMRRQDFWQRDWDRAALIGTQAGMIVIVALALWSASGVLRKKS